MSKTLRQARVGDIVRLARRPVTIELAGTYGEIGVRSFGKGIFHKEPVSGADLGTKRVFRIEPGDLVLSNVFAWEGAIAVATDAEHGRIGSHRFMTYVPLDEDVDPNFLRYFFISESGLALIRKASPGSAGRNRTLAIDRFEDLVIPLPHIDAQRRTAAQLDTLLGRQATALERVLQQPAEAFQRALPPLIDNELKKFAAGIATVGELAQIISDVVHPGDDPTPAAEFIGLEHIESHTGRRIGARPVGDEQGRKFRFQRGDVIYGYLRPYLNKVWVADRPGLCSVDQYVLRPRDGVQAGLLGHVLRSASTLQQSIDLTHNLQLPRLRSGLLLGLEVPVVAVEDQSKAEERLDGLVDQMTALAAARHSQRVALEAVAASALNRAFASLM